MVAHNDDTHHGVPEPGARRAHVPQGKIYLMKQTIILTAVAILLTGIVVWGITAVL
jgi:hypothetical protein